MGHLQCPAAVRGGLRARKQGVPERRLHPQNWSLTAILATCLGTRTHLFGTAQSITAKARSPSDEQPKEESLCGRSPCKCWAKPLQQHITWMAGPLHVHPMVPVPSTAHHSSSQPVHQLSSRYFPQLQGMHTQLKCREVTEVQCGAGMCKKTSLWSKAITYGARPTSNTTRKGRHLDLPAAHPQPCHRPSQRTPAQCLSGHSAVVHWQTPQQPELGLVLFLYCFFTPQRWKMLYFLCQLAQVQSWHSRPYCSPDQGSFGLQTSLPACLQNSRLSPKQPQAQPRLGWQEKSGIRCSGAAAWSMVPTHESSIAAARLQRR